MSRSRYQVTLSVVAMSVVNRIAGIGAKAIASKLLEKLLLLSGPFIGPIVRHLGTIGVDAEITTTL